ncbi:MAG: S9 family peptidase [Chloroflexi bacterium]|nr:S9 family peptidase [Chloroflexota bacterium]
MGSLTEVELIKRSVLFGNPERTSVQISPDGKHLSFLAPDEGFLNVWVAPVSDPAAARVVTNDHVRGIRIYRWAHNSEYLIYMQDSGGDENWNVFTIEVATNEIANLTPFKDVAAHIAGASVRHPDDILLSINDRDPRYHDLYRANVRTGELELLAENTDGFSGYVTDQDLKVRLAERMTEDGGSEVLAPDGDGWEKIITIPPDDNLTTGVHGFDSSGRVIYLSDSRDRDTGALTSLDLETGELTVLAEDPRADVSDLMIHPISRTPEAVAFTYERKRWVVLDESVRGDLDYLATVADGEVEVVSRTDADDFWVVAYLLDDGPVAYYLYDREAQAASYLFSSRPELESLPLVKMHPVVVTARDGLEMVCYLSLPSGSNPGGEARPQSPVPMVLYVHGGPWARDRWGYDPYHQLFANRGYAVLSVNYRTSTGFGKDFANAGRLEWGGKMQDDLTDAVEWAVTEGIAIRERVAIMGGSYGGYATLAGLTMTPELYACGVDIVGPSNLITLLETVPPYWTPIIETFTTRMGDHRTEEGRALLKSRSPLTFVDQIRRPLLIGQGANDPRVKQSESDQIIEAMTSRGIPVTYVLYPDEGHGFARPENRLAFNAVAEAFLAEFLGGRKQPVGDDFAGSSITVPVGAGQFEDVSGSLGESG